MSTPLGSMVSLMLWAGAAGADGDPLAEVAARLRPPAGSTPVIMAWFWGPKHFEPRGYVPFLEMMARHSAVTMLATSIRAPLREVTEPAVHAQVKAAAAYAKKLGMPMVMDLDVRLARQAFRKAYPDDLQEMLRLREVKLSGNEATALTVKSDDLRDHYTFQTTNYIPLSGRLVRVYAYRREGKLIMPDTVGEITRQVRVLRASAKDVAVQIPAEPSLAGHTACVMVAFTHLAPDVFAPHLDAFQAAIIESYKDTDIMGACKDEWGFPPCYDGCPAKNDYWFSRSRARAYAERTGGRDLLRDCLLMTYGESGRQVERQVAVNHFLDMARRRNAAVEDHLHKTVKRVFGPSGVAATHPTWMPYPGVAEFKKNGLHWWQATRDLAQTDEYTPFPCRTALAKKWGSGPWWNMYYARDLGSYEFSLWSHALGGGRIDYHPVYPTKDKKDRADRYKMLLRGGLMVGDCRVRLLNVISSAALDCPVAVVFGHACAMNWAGPAYDDVGLRITDALWGKGYPADLIPASEVGSRALRVAEDGRLAYGDQRYRAAVLLHPQFEGKSTAGLFRAVAERGATKVVRVGAWAHDFDGKPFDGTAALGDAVKTVPDQHQAVAHIVADLERIGVEPQTPATASIGKRPCGMVAPARKGRCRLVDGTEIILSGEQDVSGDPIKAAVRLAGREVTVDALGVVALRVSRDGRIDAMAAGGMKRFETKGLSLELPGRAGVALWREVNGGFRGVVQGLDGPLPAALKDLTTDWIRLDLPKPYTDGSSGP